MSFLLRNRCSKESSKAGWYKSPFGREAGNKKGRILRAGSSTCTQTTNQLRRLPKNTMDSGNQVLVHREREQQSHRPLNSLQSQSIRSVDKHLPTEAVLIHNQESQCAISMTEVLADLRILEQQQREAQRQVVTARLTKERRLQEHATLQGNLEHLKYSNGELRAQLRQSRELLSVGTRVLGTRRLATERAGNDIRDFEKQLKHALVSARMNAACHRKIESLFIVVENKYCKISRLKEEAQEKLIGLDKEVKAERARETNLRDRIQREVAEIQRWVQGMAAARIQCTEAEKELLASQCMEESTRSRADEVALQKAAEKERENENLENLERELKMKEEEIKKLVIDNTNHSDKLTHRKSDLLKIAARPKQHFQFFASTKVLVPYDVVEGKVKLQVDNNAREELRISDENSIIKKEIENMKRDLEKIKQETRTNYQSGSEIKDTSASTMSNEKRRQNEMVSFRNELDLERERLQKLILSSKEQATAQSSLSEKHQEHLRECNDQIFQVRETIERHRTMIEEIRSAIEDSNKAWQSEKGSICAKLEEARHQLMSTKIKQTTMESKYQESSEASERHVQARVNEVREHRMKQIRNIERKAAAVMKDYPKLVDISSAFVYDCRATKKAQTIEALKKIKSELESTIRTAKATRENKNKLRKDARRKSARAVAIVKLKEEKRLENREIIDIDIQEGREEKPPTTNESMPSFDTGKDDSAKTEKTKPRTYTASQKKARFFFPQAHTDDIAEKSTPIKPKQLLPSFLKGSGAENNRIQNTVGEKRVRWEENGDNELCRSEGKEIPPLQTVPHRSRQYGKSKRGLAAISRSRKRNPHFFGHNRVLSTAESGEDEEADVHYTLDQTKRELNKSSDFPTNDLVGALESKSLGKRKNGNQSLSDKTRGKKTKSVMNSTGIRSSVSKALHPKSSPSSSTCTDGQLLTSPQKSIRTPLQSPISSGGIDRNRTRKSPTSGSKASYKKLFSQTADYSKYTNEKKVVSKKQKYRLSFGDNNCEQKSASGKRKSRDQLGSSSKITGRPLHESALSSRRRKKKKANIRSKHRAARLVEDSFGFAF